MRTESQLRFTSAEDADHLPDRLRSARKTMGWSTRTVAEKVSRWTPLSHATIANYEKGKTRPPADVVAALAEIYGRPIQWFFERGVALTGVRYRNTKSRVRVSERTNYEGVAQNWLRAYVALEQHMNEPLTAKLQADKFAGKMPKLIATKIRTKLNLAPNDPIVSVIEILELFGVRAIEIGTDKAIDGFAGKFGEEFVVVLNGESSNDRIRMNASHELGHILMGDCVENAHDDKLIEKKAFEFASHLLLTSEMLNEAFRGKSMVRLLQFKERFGISLAAMIYRAQNEKILNAKMTKRLWVEFSRRGWRKSEPGNVRADRAIRFETLIDSAMLERDYSVESLARIMSVREDELKRRLVIAEGCLDDANQEESPERILRLADYD